MKACYCNAFKAADGSKTRGKWAGSVIKSIAFPSLGTGGHSYPIEEACPIALRTVLADLPKYPSIGLVRFVLFSDFDLDFYQETYAKIVK